MSEQVLQIDESSFMVKGPGGPGPVAGSGPGHAVVGLTLRDPTEMSLDGHASGTVSVSTTRGVVKGSIDESFANEFHVEPGFAICSSRQSCPRAVPLYDRAWQ
jgi:hypothetical protein